MVAARFRSSIPLLAAVTLLLTALAPATAAAQEYKTYNEAMAAAGRLLISRNFAGAQAPLEAALKLAADDTQRQRAYMALVPAYRLLPDTAKMYEAQEFIIAHNERRAGRHNAATDIASFLHQRGKTDEGVQRYEARLKQNPKDIVALTILATVYTHHKREDARGPALTIRRDEADRELAAALAERLEKDAESAPRQTAWHLQDAASAWLEAGDHAKALAAAKKSAASPPEQRTAQLTLYWHEGLGDVFREVGENKLALTHYEAAMAVPINEALKKSTEKKLAELKAKP